MSADRPMKAILNLGLFGADITAMLLLTLLPAIVFADWRFKKSVNRLRILALLAASVLALHLSYIATWLWLMAHPPSGVLVLDPHPLDQMLTFTINWTVPSGFIAILLILAIAQSQAKTARVILGVISFVLSAVAAVVYGKCWFDVCLGLDLAKCVWWL